MNKPIYQLSEVFRFNNPRGLGEGRTLILGYQLVPTEGDPLGFSVRHVFTIAGGAGEVVARAEEPSSKKAPAYLVSPVFNPKTRTEHRKATVRRLRKAFSDWAQSTADWDNGGSGLFWAALEKLKNGDALNAPIPRHSFAPITAVNPLT